MANPKATPSAKKTPNDAFLFTKARSMYSPSRILDSGSGAAIVV